MPRSADLPLPAATDARTANVTFSLGCAAVAPGALATLAAAALNVPRFRYFAYDASAAVAAAGWLV